MLTRKILAVAALFVITPCVSAYAGAVGGPKYRDTSVDAESSDRYHVSFYGGELARVVVDGDGDTDLDLYVYDEYGNLIDSDTDGTDFCVCTWVPSWTGSFTIVVRNLGSVYNCYGIRTN